jgi:ribosomal protein S18 acetylase RimI-like enzyme
MSELSFRFATADDIPVLVALTESAYRGDASRAGWTTEADLLDGQRTDLEEITRLVAGPSTRFLLAVRDGYVIGSVLLSSNDDHVYIGMFAVSPVEQNRGLGRKMLEEAEAISRREAFARTEMTVIGQRPELIAWYRRRGYEVTGERRAFPYGDLRFGQPRRADLYFEVMTKSLS